jgi:hypothetical protein
MSLFIRIFVIALATLMLPAIGAQDLRAVTEDGRKVVLSSDGKWKFDSSGVRLNTATVNVKEHRIQASETLALRSHQ